MDLQVEWKSLYLNISNIHWLACVAELCHRARAVLLKQETFEKMYILHLSCILDTINNSLMLGSSLSFIAISVPSLFDSPAVILLLSFPHLSC